MLFCLIINEFYFFVVSRKFVKVCTETKPVQECKNGAVIIDGFSYCAPSVRYDYLTGFGEEEIEDYFDFLRIIPNQ